MKLSFHTTTTSDTFYKMTIRILSMSERLLTSSYHGVRMLSYLGLVVVK